MNPSPRGRSAATALRVLALAALAGLSACSASLLPKAPPAAARYTLDAAPPTTRAPAFATAATAANAPVLLVAQPGAAPGYDTVHMLYQRQPRQLEAYAYHEWVAPPADLLAPLLVRALQETPAFRVVLLAPTSGSGTVQLETEVVRLLQDFTAQPSSVRLTLRAVLIDSRSRQVIASRVFDATVPADRDDPVAGVAAAQQAVLRVLRELAAWAQGAPTTAAR